MVTWRTVHEEPDYPLRIEHAHVDGLTIRRVVAGNGSDTGAVAVAVREDGAVLLVRQVRAAIDRTLWELPRGFADADDLDGEHTARRELMEETGVRAERGTVLGHVYPDSGLLSSAVTVVRFDVADDQEAIADGVEVDDTAWVPSQRLRDLVRDGSLRDAISLSALAVAGLL